VQLGDIGAPQIQDALGAKRRNYMQGEDTLVFVGCPRLALGLDMLVEKFGGNGLKGPNLARRFPLGDGVFATLDRAENNFCLSARFLWRQTTMLADAGRARATVLPVLSDVALVSVAERRDAKASNCLPMAAIPKDFRSFLGGQVRASTLVLVIGPAAIVCPSSPARGKCMVSTVSKWRAQSDHRCQPMKSLGRTTAWFVWNLVHRRMMRSLRKFLMVKLLIRGSWVRFSPRSPNKSYS
jgi:hypothetical protein